MIVWGYTNKEIAARLCLSVKTVEAHKVNAMRKLGVNRRAEVVRTAYEWGWFNKSEAPQPPAEVAAPPRA